MASVPALTSSRQRAAAFVLAIGSGRAEEVIQYLKPSEVETLAEEVARLASFDSATRKEIMEAAVEHMLTIDPASEAAALRKKAREMAIHANATAPFDPKHPFEFLENVELEQAVQFLSREHPQTVAVILANQRPTLASKILEMMDERLAGDISLRIATIGRTTTELMERIEMAMRRRLTEADTNEVTAPDGAKELAAILNNADRSVEDNVLKVLHEFDEELAERVRSLMFVFEDIITLDDKAIQQVLQNVETTTLAMSLKGTPELVRQAILRNLSERAREALSEEIDLLGAVRRTDVADAQTAIVSQIRALEAAGQIVIARGDDSDLVE